MRQRLVLVIGVFLAAGLIAHLAVAQEPGTSLVSIMGFLTASLGAGMSVVCFELTADCRCQLLAAISEAVRSQTA